jgi:hypothetical protein
VDLGSTLVLIVLIVTIGQVLQSWAKRGGKAAKVISDPDSAMLKQEVLRLRERVVVLERIATDKNHLLEHEFERLRD